MSSQDAYEVQSPHSLLMGPFLRDCGTSLLEKFYSFSCLLPLQREIAPPRALLGDTDQIVCQDTQPPSQTEVGHKYNQSIEKLINDRMVYNFNSMAWCGKIF